MIIFPAVYIGYEELYYSLLSMDLNNVLVICEKAFLEEYSIKGNFIVDDFANIDKLILKISDFEKEYDGIIGIDDEEQFMITKKIADYFKIKWYSLETLQISSNKFIMKKRFLEEKVPTGKFELVSDLNVSINFPNVLKIITGTGSEFIFKNEYKQEFEENFKFLKEKLKNIKDDERFRKIRFNDKEFDPCKEFLLEEYIGGEEYSCDFMVDNGVHILRVVKKFQSDHFGLYEGYYLMNNDSINECMDINELKEICKRISKAFNIDKGVCMVDFKVDNGIKVIESSIRPGLSSFIPLMHKVYGYTSLGILSGVNFNGIPKKEGLIVHLLASKKGIISKLDVSNVKGDVHLFCGSGDVVEDSLIDHADLLLGYVMIKNPENITKIFKEIKENVVMMIKDE